MARHASRWRRMLSDATFLYLLPLMVGILPWRLGFALLKRIARSDAVFSDVVEAAWQRAGSVYPQLGRTRFCRRFRLLLLLDRTDSALCLLRGRRWWRGQVDVAEGSLDLLQPGLLLTSHWGSGNWLWRVLESRGIDGHFVARRPGVEDLGRGWLTRGYMAWRYWAVRHSGCRGVIYTGNSSVRVLQTLGEGRAIVGMLDLAARPGRPAAAVRVLDCPMRFPTGLLLLAGQAQVPVTLVSCGLDEHTGRRLLYVEALPATLTVDEAMQRYADHLTRRIHADPAAWFAWPGMPDGRTAAAATGLSPRKHGA